MERASVMVHEIDSQPAADVELEAEPAAVGRPADRVAGGRLQAHREQVAGRGVVDVQAPALRPGERDVTAIG